MKASVQYNDFRGNASADIADSQTRETIAKIANLDTERYTLLGISLYGTEDMDVTLICRDNKDSTPEKEILVDITPANTITVEQLFKRLHVTINISGNGKYDDPDLDTDRELTLEDDE